MYVRVCVCVCGGGGGGGGGGVVATGRLCLVITNFGVRVHLLRPVSLLQTFFGNS